MAPKKKTGRPPKPPGEKWVFVGLRLPPTELARVDALVEPEQTRNDVLRHLIDLGLQTQKNRPRSKTRAA